MSKTIRFMAMAGLVALSVSCSASDGEPDQEPREGDRLLELLETGFLAPLHSDGHRLIAVADHATRLRFFALLPEAMNPRHICKPRAFQYGCSVGIVPAEEFCAELLDNADEELRLGAAETLWCVHSRSYAEKVREAAATGARDSQLGRWRELALRIAADLRPEAILAELEGKDQEWWCWLASLAPHPSLVEPLIRLLDEEEPSLSVIHALGAQGDSRGVAPLIRIAARDDHTLPGVIPRGVAVSALGSIGDQRAEPTLLAVLPHADCWLLWRTCAALGSAGTAAALPQLDIVAAAPSCGVIMTNGVARQAAAAIRSRE